MLINHKGIPPPQMISKEKFNFQNAILICFDRMEISKRIYHAFSLHITSRNFTIYFNHTSTIIISSITNMIVWCYVIDYRLDVSRTYFGTNRCLCHCIWDMIDFINSLATEVYNGNLEFVILQCIFVFDMIDILCVAGAITWTIFDQALCCHIASLLTNKLMNVTGCKSNYLAFSF